jgi:hypothetical protein
MTTSSIIKEINRLPLSKRMLVIEKAIRSIRSANSKDILKQAADKLQFIYKEDKELTVFTALDYTDFYETR